MPSCISTTNQYSGTHFTYLKQPPDHCGAGCITWPHVTGGKKSYESWTPTVPGCMSAVCQPSGSHLTFLKHLTDHCEAKIWSHQVACNINFILLKTGPWFQQTTSLVEPTSPVWNSNWPLWNCCHETNQTDLPFKSILHSASLKQKHQLKQHLQTSVVSQ